MPLRVDAKHVMQAEIHYELYRTQDPCTVWSSVQELREGEMPLHDM